MEICSGEDSGETLITGRTLLRSLEASNLHRGQIRQWEVFIKLCVTVCDGREEYLSVLPAVLY